MLFSLIYFMLGLGYFLATKFQTFAEMTEKISSIFKIFLAIKILQKQNFKWLKNFVCINIILSLYNRNYKF